MCAVINQLTFSYYMLWIQNFCVSYVCDQEVSLSQTLVKVRQEDTGKDGVRQPYETGPETHQHGALHVF